jgi:hypothetical protein
VNGTPSSLFLEKSSRRLQDLGLVRRITWISVTRNGNHSLESEIMDLVSKFNSGELIALVVVTLGVSTGLVLGLSAILTEYWLKFRQLQLKQDMLNRGMSAEEICTVLEAGSKDSHRALRRLHSCGR